MKWQHKKAPNCPRRNEAPRLFLSFGSSSTALKIAMSGERSTASMLVGHIPGARARSMSSIFMVGLSMCSRRNHDRGKGDYGTGFAVGSPPNSIWGLSGLGDRPGDVVWLDCMAPHRHLVEVTVTIVCGRTEVSLRCLLPCRSPEALQRGET
jgi:hypothetical protein